MRRHLPLLIALLCISITSYAQSGVLKGRVADKEQQALPGATVMLVGTTHGATSNLDGEYLLTKVAEGKHTIEVRYMGYKPVTQEVNVEKGKTVELNFEMEIGVELKTVIVNSRLEGESKALNQQKNAQNITTIISAEQLEKFPDANVGDALKRIPGINVQYDQGEARFGNVRGTAPELNSITINGERIPSAEAEIRSVQLDLLPADMIQTIEFNKAITADMDADAIGGSINLVTKSAPYKPLFAGSMSGGWNMVSNKPTYNIALTYGRRFLNNKVGMIASASLHNNQLGSDNIEAEWDYEDENDKDNTAFVNDFQNRQYYLRRLRQSYSLSFDYKINSKHTLYAKGIYNHRNDWENRYRLRYKDIEKDANGDYVAEIRRQTKFGVKDNKYSRLEDQCMMNYALGGDHLFGSLKMDWSAAYSKASEERPNERYISYRAKDVLVDVDLSNKNKPVVTPRDMNLYGNFTDEFSLKELTEEYQYTDEVDKNFRLDFELPMMRGNFANSLKFGARYRGKEKKRDNEFYEYEPVDANAEDALNALVMSNLSDISKDNFLAGDYSMGNFVDREISDKLDLEDKNMFDKTEVLAEYAGNFDATEDVLAGYLMLDQKLGKKLSMLAGLRVEQTLLAYSGFRYFEAADSLVASEKVEEDYQNVLPNVHFKYELNPRTNLRLAWTHTLARPNYFDLVPYQEINEDDEITIGNPMLKATESMNLDLLAEHFFSNVGVVSAGVFYKDMKNVIAFEHHSDYTYNGTLYPHFRQPRNIANASLFGFEVALSRKLNFLPSFLSKMTFYGNYTYTQSKLEDIQIEGREDDLIPLGGSPAHTLNLSLAYDARNLDVRVSYNHASAFLNNTDDGGLGDEAYFDFYYDKVNYLDVNADYKFHPNWTVFANAKNLLNQPLRTYWGSVERVAQDEYYGIRFNIGVKFKY